MTPEALYDEHKLLVAISRIYSLFFESTEYGPTFDALLDTLLEITGSEYGFIGEVRHDTEGAPFLKTHAITNIAWNEETRKLYETYSKVGFEFGNLNTLFGEVMKTGKPVISNKPSEDPRRAGIPPGHPALNAFLGIPFWRGERMVGMVGIANRAEGYDESIIEYLDVFLKTCANIIHSLRSEEEREAAELALKKRDRQLSESQMVAKLGSWDLDLVTGELDWSDQTYRLFDRGRQTFNPSFEAFAQMVHPDDRDTMQTRFDRALASDDDPYHVVIRITNGTGREWIMEAFGKVKRDKNGKPLSIVGTAQDVTERKNAEYALKKSEEHYRALFESSPISLWEEDLSEAKKGLEEIQNNGTTDVKDYLVKNPEKALDLISRTEVLDVNEATLRLFKAATKDELIGNLGKVLTEESLNAAVKNLVSLFGGASRFETECVNNTLDGEKLDLLMNCSVVPGHEKDWSRVLLSFLDLTELRKAESYIITVLETVDEGYIVIDREFNIVSANRAYLSQFGKHEHEIVGRKCHEVSHGSPHRCYEAGENCPVIKTFDTGKPQGVMHIHKDGWGNEFYAEVKSYPVWDSKGSVISAIETVTDVTARYRAEEERQRAQRLESLGVLAGGIAHDFNNLLATIFANVSLARMKAQHGTEMYQRLVKIEDGLAKTTDLTQQLLTFSKGGAPVRKPQSILPLIHDSVHFALSGSDIEETINVADDLWDVNIDGGQINQVIQNLVLNARDAMPEGGTFEVKAENTQVGADDIPQLAEGRYVLISASDTGVGIPQDILPKVFDPYFTTKEDGSGLGLATCYSIIKNHDGAMTILSEEGVGTTLTIYLPAVAVKATEAPRQSNIVKGEGRRVLLMDDDESIRVIGEELLATLGFEAKTSRKGETAISMYKEALSSGKSFDFVILDLTIKGGMGGKKTIEKLREIAPDVKGILSSGYGEVEAVANWKEMGFKAVLPKPYRIEQLSEAIRTVLSEAV